MDNETIRNLEYAISQKRPDGRTLLVWGTHSAQGDFWRQIVPDRVKTADIPMQMKEYLSGCSILFDMYDGKVIRLPYMDVCCSVTDECSIEDVLKALVNSVTSKERRENWLPSANYYAGNLNGKTRVPKRSDPLPKRG